MLRPIYHYLLYKYDFQESDHPKPWYQQSIPAAVVENEKAKIIWDLPFHLDKAPENGANRIDMAVLDKGKKTWILVEGTICTVGSIEERTRHKHEKYTDLRAGIKNIYRDCTVIQKNIVFDFLGGYHNVLEKEINSLTTNSQETDYLLKKSQKWILSQNAEIVKKFYEFTAQ